MRIAISYSSRQRRRVLRITRFLQNRMVTPQCPKPVFFDRDFQHEICRLNGQTHLHSIYRQAQLVVVFLSPTYTDSRYCTGEWRTIAQRFLSTMENREATQLLLVKLGQYDMQKMNLTDADFAVNGERMTNEAIAQLIKERWDCIEENLARNRE